MKPAQYQVSSEPFMVGVLRCPWFRRLQSLQSSGKSLVLGDDNCKAQCRRLEAILRI